MKMRCVGFEVLSRTDKTTGAVTNAVKLYFNYPKNNVVGECVREEYIGERSVAYPTLRQIIGTNANSLVGAVINLDYDVEKYGDKYSKVLVGFELVPKK